MVDRLEDAAAREERVDEVIAAYLQAAQTGRKPNPREWLARFPDLADELGEFLADQEQFDLLAAPLRDLLTPPGSATTTVNLAVTDTLRLSAKVPPRRLGDYELLEEIARGAMGVVYKGRQVSLNRVVALKMIIAGELASPAELQRFRTEAENAAGLDHPHIVPVYDVGEHQGRPYFSMKLVEGGNLTQHLPRLTRDPRAGARLLAVVARAVHHAHQHGILHRDLKPANILLDGRGEPQVTDFGLAKRLRGDAGLTRTNAVVGTPAYMAPEQAAGNGKQLATAADVYSLGAILYELLAGSPPFRGVTPLETLNRVLHEEPVPPSRLRPKVPRDLETICLKCLSKEPERRYASAEALAKDLESFLAGDPIQARPVGAWERGVKWVKRRPASAALFAVSMFAVVVLLAGGLYFTNQLEDRTLAAEKERDRAQRGEKEANKQRRRARDREAEVNRQLMHVRHHLYCSQLLRVALLWESDPDLGLQLLNDPERCPQALRDFAWGLYYRLCKRERQTIMAGPVTAMAITGDGRTLASSVWTDPGDKPVAEKIKLWDTGTGKLVAALRGHTAVVGALAFTATGSLLASGSDDGSVIVWDMATRKPRVQFKVPDFVMRLEFAADGKVLLACSDDQVHLWDLVAEKELLLPIKNQDEKQIKTGALSPDGKLVATSHSIDKTVRVWNLAAGRELHRFKPANSFSMALAFSPDGKFLASGEFHAGVILIWDLATGKQRAALFCNEADTQYLAFTGDGGGLFAAGQERPMQLWDLASGRVRVCLRNVHDSLLATSADGMTVAGVVRGTGEEVIKVWDLSRSEVSISFHSRQRWSSGWSSLASNGATLVTGDRNLLRLWDTETGKVRSTLTGLTKHVRCAALTSGRRMHAFTGKDNVIRVWDVVAGKLVKTVLPPRGALVPSLAISPNGLVLAFRWWRPPPDGRFPVRTSNNVTGLVVWDLVNNRQRFARSRDCIPEPPDSSFNVLLFSPDGKTLLCQESSSRVTLLDVRTGRERISWTLKAHAARFRYDGALLALACDDKTIRLWDLALNRECGCLRGHTDNVLSLAISPDGRTLASGGWDKMVRLWDVGSGLELASLQGATGDVKQLAFSQDGQRLVSVDTAGHVRVWKASFPPKVQRQGKAKLP
jgi:WD40 repeat protein